MMGLVFVLMLTYVLLTIHVLTLTITATNWNLSKGSTLVLTSTPHEHTCNTVDLYLISAESYILGVLCIYLHPECIYNYIIIFTQTMKWGRRKTATNLKGGAGLH